MCNRGIAILRICGKSLSLSQTKKLSIVGDKGEGFVSFELFEKGEQSLLRLTNEGLETFPRDIPEFSRESCKAGWEYFIQQNLKAYLEKEKRI